VYRANAELTAEKEQLNKTLLEKDQKMEKIKILLRRQKQQLGGAGAAATATPPATPPTFVSAPEAEAPAPRLILFPFFSSPFLF